MKIRALGTEFDLEAEKVEESKEDIRSRLEEFLSGERSSLDLKYELPDTPTGKILEEVSEMTYGEIAESTESSAVAVGQACARNPLILVVPCHRVVGKDGIGGYRAGKAVKRRLLELERTNEKSSFPK